MQAARCPSSGTRSGTQERRGRGRRRRRRRGGRRGVLAEEKRGKIFINFPESWRHKLSADLPGAHLGL